MKCPRCENSILEERDRDGIVIDVCRECRGIWLDRSELERILARALREEQEQAGPQPVPPAPPPASAPPPAPASAPPPAPAYAPPPAPAYAPPPAPAYAPPPGYEQPRAPGGYYHRDDDTPPHGLRRDGGRHHPHRRKHWFESLTDIFD